MGPLRLSGRKYRGALTAALLQAAASAAMSAAAAPPHAPMNSRPYTISPTSAAKNNPTARAPAFRGEFFEMYGHWQNTTYSEVDWHADPVPLPAEIGPFVARGRPDRAVRTFADLSPDG